jgi:hypothetical protein
VRWSKEKVPLGFKNPESPSDEKIGEPYCLYLKKRIIDIFTDKLYFDEHYRFI